MGNHTGNPTGEKKAVKGGTLRDFRVNAGASSQDSIGSTRASESAVPAQSVRSRTEISKELTNPTLTRPSPLREHTYAPSKMSVDALWESWSSELSTQSIDNRVPKTAPPVTAPQASPKTGPLAGTKEVSGEILLGESLHQIPWSVALAIDERRLEQEGQVELSSSYRKQELLVEKTRGFAKKLQEAFRTHVELFNQSRRSPGHVIHIYKVSHSDSDFMLFRNGVRLVVSSATAGRISFTFNQYLGQIYAPRQNPQVLIEAQWGALEQLFWTYRNEKVSLEDLVQYFLRDFVQQSYR